MKIKLTNACFLFRNQQLMIIMRTFIFLFCTTLFALNPSEIISQNSKIKIKENKIVTVDEVFDLIMDQTDYKFFYEEGIFKSFPKIKLKKGIISTSKLLKKSLSKGNLDIKLTSNNAILIKEKPKSIILTKNPEEVQIEISGTVTDTQGQPLPGANILVKGTTNGTQTNFDGNYTISAPSDATLVFSFIGYATKEVAVNSQTTINISLAEDASQLEEVVIVGYGTLKKKDVTGAVATVGAKDIENLTFNDPAQTLQGRMAGVSVDQELLMV